MDILTPMYLTMPAAFSAQLGDTLKVMAMPPLGVLDTLAT